MFNLPEGAYGRLPVGSGDIIFLEGQKADKSYVILQGHVDIIIRDPAGDEFGIDRLGPGELFGEIALLRRDQTRTATVVAVDSCELLEFTRDVFDERLSSADPFLRFVLEHMTRRLVNTTGRLVMERAR